MTDNCEPSEARIAKLRIAGGGLLLAGLAFVKLMAACYGLVAAAPIDVSPLYAIHLMDFVRLAFIGSVPATASCLAGAALLLFDAPAAARTWASDIC